MGKTSTKGEMLARLERYEQQARDALKNLGYPETWDAYKAAVDLHFSGPFDHPELQERVGQIYALLDLVERARKALKADDTPTAMRAMEAVVWGQVRAELPIYESTLNSRRQRKTAQHRKDKRGALGEVLAQVVQSRGYLQRRAEGKSRVDAALAYLDDHDYLFASTIMEVDEEAKCVRWISRNGAEKETRFDAMAKRLERLDRA